MPRTHGYSLKGTRCYGLRAWGERGRINVIGALRDNPENSPKFKVQ